MNIQRFPSTFTLPNRKLNIKFGIDPTSDKLHLGHLVPLKIVKDFKDKGNNIDIVIGTFTAQMGDPSGKDTMRPMLSFKETSENAESIIKQVKRILGDDINIHFNHVWFEKMTMIDMMGILSKFTTNNLLSRDSFQKRMENSDPIGLHELIVPILQGIDSVNLNTDVEIGGTDQLFNFKLSRDMQSTVGMEPENCLMAPIINGTDGRKMSKSFNNCIFINDNNIDVFGKSMSISDSTMNEWCEVFMPNSNIEHPMERKKALAHSITSLIWGNDLADQALENFISTVQNKNIPSSISEINEKKLVEVVKIVRKSSNNVARQLLTSNAVKVNNKVINSDIELSIGDIVKVGKRDFVKIV